MKVLTIHSSTPIDLLFEMAVTLVAPFRQAQSYYFAIIRTIVSSPQLNIELEMRRLNQTKQFTKTLDLFDKYQHHGTLTDRVIVQALKACTQLGFLERGQNIHKKLSSQLKNGIYVQTSLIHFYSKFALFV